MPSKNEALRRLDTLQADLDETLCRMLAAIARSFDGYLDAVNPITHKFLPLRLRREHTALLDALDTLCIEHREPAATPAGIDFVLKDHGFNDFSEAGAAHWLWDWDPGSRTSIEWSIECVRLLQERFDVGQHVWREALYRWFDWDQRLLYAGITADLATRQGSHIKRSTWAEFAASATVLRYPNRHSVEQFERRAIEMEQPLFNHQHNNTPEARQRLVDYLISKGRTDLLAPAVSRG